MKNSANGHAGGLRKSGAAAKKPKMLSKPVNKPLLALDPDPIDSNDGSLSIDSEDERGNGDPWNNGTHNEDSPELLPHGSSLLRMSFAERMGHYADRRKEHAVRRAMKVLAEEQADCTFAPRVGKATRRSLKGFLKDQEAFLESKAQKLKSLRVAVAESELKTVQPSPRIDPKSSLICSMKPRTDRLYKTNVKPMIIEEPSPPKLRRKFSNNLLKPRHKSAKRLKNVREEKEAVQKKKEEELASMKKKLKETSRLRSRLERELQAVFNAHSVNSFVTYNEFCNCCVML